VLPSTVTLPETKTELRYEFSLSLEDNRFPFYNAKFNSVYL
jgi:hypothetical protein